MYPTEKGFSTKKNLIKMGDSKMLIKQVLTPTFITVPDHTHQLPRGVQSEGTRSPRQFKSGLFGCPVTLAVIASVAARHQVFPRRPASTRTRHYVIQR